MLFKNNKKFESVFTNGKSWKKGYLNGNLIFSKGTVDRYFMDLWWKDSSGNINKEEIRDLSDFNVLCEYYSSSTKTYRLSNGHSFNNRNIIDFDFKNATDFPVTIDEGFGYKWSALNMGLYSGESSITIPDNCNVIDNYFLSGSSFNTVININNVNTINDDFLSSSSKFNKPINLSNITIIGDNFLKDNLIFNQPLEVYAENIGTGFLSQTSSTKTNKFNSNLTLYNTTTIGDNFLSGQPSKPNIFNANLSLPNTLESIGNDFLRNCNYAKVIDLSNTNITSIGDNFNTEGKISNILLPTKNQLTIGTDFMSSHEGSISSKFIIPSNVIYIGEGFLYCAEDYYTFDKIECNADPSSWASDGYNKSMCYLKHNTDDMQYITVTGTYANELKAKYPSSRASESYDACRYYAEEVH